VNHLWHVPSEPPLPPLPPHVRALFDRAHAIPPLPESVRARALTRARAALVAGFDRRPGPAEVPSTRWTTAAALIGLLGITFAAAAYQVRARLAPRPTSHRVR
jgi:hypothetical protein